MKVLQFHGHTGTRARRETATGRNCGEVGRVGAVSRSAARNLGNPCARGRPPRLPVCVQ